MNWNNKLILALFVICFISCIPPPYEIEGEIKTYGQIISDKDGSVMVLVPAGSFMMGRKDKGPPEGPQHRVYLDAFYIDKYELTNSQYELFDPEHKRSHFSKCDNCPVSNLSWEAANAYAKWAGKRLPTEAEWEKAAGSGERKWPWGNRFSYFQANIISRKDGYLNTSPVGSFPLGSSPYAVMDMAGNVWEWCSDWYGRNYYKDSPEKNPKGPDGGTAKVARGGSAITGVKSSKTTYRASFAPDAVTDDKGARFVQPAGKLPVPIN